jgi:predicted phage terminase large subunit-like protein
VGNGAVIPVMQGTPKALAEADRAQLLDLAQHYRSMGNEWLRRMIVVGNRIDILALAVLDYQIQPFHLALLRWQFLHPDNLQLVFRGAGKSTVCTITKTLHLLAKDPNLRILIASKTNSQSEAFLKEIKGHFESNDRYQELFGEYYDPQRVNKWDNREIEVAPRTSKHYDVILSDDLVDEENTRTKYMRDRVRQWYYQTLDPCLEPPSPTVAHRGEHHRLGTRYHFDDLYGHLMTNELKRKTQVIPALDEKGRSPWPEKYPAKWFKEKKRKSGTIIFNAQYQCDTEAMKGEIFQYDDCQRVADSAIPGDLRIFMGVDLAISEKESADRFAIAVVGMDAAENYFVIDFFEGHLRFGKQTAKIIQYYKKHDPVRCAIETNAYQAAQYQNLKDDEEDGKNLRLKAVHTSKDKVTRAWKLSPLFEDHRMHFTPATMKLAEQLVLFPNFRYKDGFDALDLAIAASKLKKKRKRRSSEPGVL